MLLMAADVVVPCRVASCPDTRAPDGILGLVPNRSILMLNCQQDHLAQGCGCLDIDIALGWLGPT